MSERVGKSGTAFWADAKEDVALEQYQTLVNTLDDGLYQLDADGRFVAVNDVIVESTGYDREDLLGAHVSLVLDEADISHVEDVIRELHESQSDSIETLELPIQTADGETLFCELRLSLLDIDGELHGTVGVARDITNRRNREQTLQDERRLLDRVFDASPIGIVALSPDGEVITINSRAAEIVGADPDDQDETYNTSEWEVYDADGELIPSEERTFGRVAKTGEPVTDLEVQVERRDGGRVWLSFNGAPIFDSNGELSMVVLTYEDITELKGREQHLQRERTQTEKLLQTAPVAIAVQDADGETVMANQRAQDALGLSEQEIIEEPEDADEWSIYDASGNSLAPDETPSARVLATGEPVFDEEIVIERPNGDRMWFRINAAPLLGPDGNVERVITAGEDITELKRRERQLEQRKTELETELSEILGRISDAFYALDEEFRFTHVNERAEEIMQYTAEEMLGRSVWELFPEATEGLFWEEFHTAMETQEPVTFEMYAEELDAWLEFNAYPSETGLSIYFQNVTRRVEREQTLEERERDLVQYETIVETINDGIYVADGEGRFTMVNEAYAELTGYPREELLGEHASLVIDEETLEQATELRAEMADSEATNPILEAAIKTADDDRIPTEGTFAALQTDHSGYKRIGVVRDITERKEQQRKLEESERRYRTLVEHFPNGAVGLFDEDLRYTAVGGQLMDATGVATEDRIGESILEVYPDDLVEEIEPYFHAALEGEANSFEAEYLDRDLLAYTLPIRNADDEVYAGMLVVQDITELKKTQRHLEESNERLEQFAYAASHDLQEPLRMVSSYLQLVDRRYSDALDEDGREFIDFAVDGADRMRKMIDGLLKYSRVETQGSSFEPVDLDEVLEDVRENLQMRIEESNATITATPLPDVLGDTNQLWQVFQNLISNAIEYSGDEPPKIDISAERTGQKWTVSVHDEGIGIDPDDTERIFEVFERLHSHESYSGTGIGLALAQRIVERHGGEIWANSEPGEGTTFSFTLPVVQERTDE